MKKHFITQKQIAVIVKYYGGFRKYKINETVEKEIHSFYLCEKENAHLWMVVQHDQRAEQHTKFEVRFTDETGLIVKRDRWEVVEGIPITIESE